MYFITILIISVLILKILTPLLVYDKAKGKIKIYRDFMLIENLI